MSVRIINLDEASSIQIGDFVAIDSESQGTRKFDATKLGDIVGANIASNYNPSASYAIGQFCLHDGDLYQCSVAIPSGEAWNASHWTQITVGNALYNKVDKVDGKGLSTQDFTTALKNKLDEIAAGAEVNVQANWNESDSSNDAYIQNKPVANTGLNVAGAFADAKAVGDAINTLITDIKAGTEETADYHLGFYLDANGDLWQVEND